VLSMITQPPLKGCVQNWAKKRRVPVMWRYLTMKEKTITLSSVQRVDGLSAGCHEIRFSAHRK
jgi:hypothetical protein